MQEPLRVRPLPKLLNRAEELTLFVQQKSVQKHPPIKVSFFAASKGYHFICSNKLFSKMCTPQKTGVKTEERNVIEVNYCFLPIFWCMCVLRNFSRVLQKVHLFNFF